MVSERPRARLRAVRLGTYPSSAATARTRSRVLASTLPLPLSEWETVVMETPAALATSATVTRATTR
jgi:hypothetical protein